MTILIVAITGLIIGVALGSVITRMILDEHTYGNIVTDGSDLYLSISPEDKALLDDAKIKRASFWVIKVKQEN